MQFILCYFCISSDHCCEYFQVFLFLIGGTSTVQHKMQASGSDSLCLIRYKCTCFSAIIFFLNNKHMKSPIGLYGLHISCLLFYSLYFFQGVWTLFPVITFRIWYYKKSYTFWMYINQFQFLSFFSYIIYILETSFLSVHASVYVQFTSISSDN